MPTQGVIEHIMYSSQLIPTQGVTVYILYSSQLMPTQGVTQCTFCTAVSWCPHKGSQCTFCTAVSWCHVSRWPVWHAAAHALHLSGVCQEPPLQPSGTSYNRYLNSSDAKMYKKPWNEQLCHRRINTKEKAKVVAAVWYIIYSIPCYASFFALGRFWRIGWIHPLP